MIANDSLDELFKDFKTANAAPLWIEMKKVNPHDPAPKAIPHLWAYEKMRPMLVRAGTLTTTEEAERRVAMLINPGIAKTPFTTDTLYAGLQMIMPGEIARAHKHTAFALRFIIEGHDAYTAVGGERVIMNPHDLVLTPSFEYHDHGNETGEPMIWLDGLDVPLYQSLPVHFTRFWTEERYPSEITEGPSHLIYPWADMQAQLDAQPGDFAKASYVHRRDGGPISKTIGAAAERIAAGRTSPARRETASSIYHVRSGSGRTTVGETELRWKAGDTFAVPSWLAYRHQADGGETAYLFRYDDVPLLTALGMYTDEEPTL